MDILLKNISVYALKEAYIEKEQDLFGHPDIQKRLLRAYNLLIHNEGYSIEKGVNNTWHVTNSCDISYNVDVKAHECSCPDSTGGYLCKHTLAVLLIISASQLTAKQ